jgi:hypothetical protein
MSRRPGSAAGDGLCRKCIGSSSLACTEASHFTERHVAAIFRVEAMEVTRCPGGRLRSPAGGDVYGDALTVPDMVGTLLRCQPYCGGHQPVC